MINVKQIPNTSDSHHLCVLYNDLANVKEYAKTEAEAQFLTQKLKENTPLILLNQYTRYIILIKKPQETSIHKKAEKLRKLGYELHKVCLNHHIQTLQIENNTPTSQNILDMLEGLLLSAYSFHKYKTKKQDKILKTVHIIDLSLAKHDLNETINTLAALYKAKDWINEPYSTLGVSELCENIQNYATDKGIEVEILGMQKIKSLSMGGILAVNQGSKNSPALCIMEYSPKNAINKKPIVLVGKGVVYDSGGYSLKTAEGMENMKYDMAGCAIVAAAIGAVAHNKLPVHLVAIAPITDNMVSATSFVPGDIIYMYNKKTVEVLNTDAEGRLILADALAYASKYNPMLCIDLATLTGSAKRAIGKHGIVYMGTASKQIKNKLEECGMAVNERLVEFPLWDEYGEELISDIADIKNIGAGAEAGAIIGGKFLEHFVSYPWLHLDIAGVSWSDKSDSYIGKNATATGVRLLYKYIKSLTAS
ncbi:MAG: leucyl aminopeptidase family protein [Cytophagales bacterium]|nr:leucyl aminopeptidase family protein [Cytophagales bacterium]